MRVLIIHFIIADVIYLVIVAGLLIDMIRLVLWMVLDTVMFGGGCIIRFDIMIGIVYMMILLLMIRNIKRF
jgi:hypothetical protein